MAVALLLRGALLLVGLLAVAGQILPEFDEEAVDNIRGCKFDKDNILTLTSANFLQCTKKGVWVVAFYSFQTYLEDPGEVEECWHFNFFWSELATHMRPMFKEAMGGPRPSVHIARYDITYLGDWHERQFVNKVLGWEEFDIFEQPTIILYDGESTIVMGEEEMEELTRNPEDLDQLEGFPADFEYDPPHQHYEAAHRREEKTKFIIDWINDYLVHQYDIFIEEGNSYRIGGTPNGFRLQHQPAIDWDFDPYDPTEDVLDHAREAIRSGNRTKFRRHLRHMQVINGTGINCRDYFTHQTPLHHAILLGETEVVELLIEEGADIETECQSGDTPLTKAAEGGRRGCVQALIKAGVDINAPRRDDGATALHMAAMTGNGDICVMLVRAGADIEGRTPKGYTPLMFAAMGGYYHEINSLEALLREGADIDAKDYLGWNALMHAIWVNSYMTFKLLVDHGIDLTATDNMGDSAMHYAMHCNIEECINYLLEQGVNVFQKNRMGLRAKDVLGSWDNWHRDPHNNNVYFSGAAWSWTERSLRPYVEWWHPLNYVWPFVRPDILKRARDFENKVVGGVCGAVKGWWSLYKDYYAMFGEPSLLGLTTDHWTPDDRFNMYMKFQDLNQQEMDEMDQDEMGCEGGDEVGEVWLFDMGDPWFERLKSYDELQRSVATGNWYHVDRILSHGEVWYGNTDDPEGDSDIISHVSPSDVGDECSDEEDMTGEVICPEQDVDIEIVDEKGRTPLMNSVRLQHRRMFQVLLKHGANIDATDHFGVPSLIYVVRSGNYEWTEVLLQAGANPDTMNKVEANQTAMHFACAGGYDKIVWLLMRHGGDVDRRDSLGRTCLNYASANGHHDLVTWLKDHGACMNINKICQGFNPMDLKADFTGPDPNQVGVGAPDPEGSVYIPEDLYDEDSPRFIGVMEDEEI